MKPLRVSAAALAFIAAASSSATDVAAASATSGKVLVQQSCMSCHAIAPGQQSPNPKAPAFAAVANEPSATPYSLRIFLQTTHTTMPNFVIKSDDIDDIVAYIVSLKQKP
jgi:cytochrome c